MSAPLVEEVSNGCVHPSRLRLAANATGWRTTTTTSRS
jgi:hypothetical protein